MLHGDAKASPEKHTPQTELQMAFPFYGNAIVAFGPIEAPSTHSITRGRPTVYSAGPSCYDARVQARHESVIMCRRLTAPTTAREGAAL